MALNFPISPLLNDQYTDGDTTWQWDGAAWLKVSDIADDAVTYAKMQNVSAASKLLGRGDSGSGDVQEITLGSNLTMTGTTLSASGGSSQITFGTWSMPAPQEFLGDEILIAQPNGHVNATILLIGFPALTLTGGVQFSMSNSSYTYSIKSWMSQAALSTKGGWRTALGLWLPVTASVERSMFWGGYYGVNDGVTITNVRSFIGFCATGSEMSDFDATSLQNALGFRKAPGSNNFAFIVSGSNTANSQIIDLGSSFSPTITTSFYFAIYLPKTAHNGTNNINYYAKNLVTGAVASGTISQTWASTHAPQTAAGVQFHAWRQSTVSGTSSVFIGRQMFFESKI